MYSVYVYIYIYIYIEREREIALVPPSPLQLALPAWGGKRGRTGPPSMCSLAGTLAIITVKSAAVCAVCAQCMHAWTRTGYESGAGAPIVDTEIERRPRYRETERLRDGDPRHTLPLAARESEPDRGPGDGPARCAKQPAGDVGIVRGYMPASQPASQPNNQPAKQRRRRNSFEVDKGARYQ